MTKSEQGRKEWNEIQGGEFDYRSACTKLQKRIKELEGKLEKAREALERIYKSEWLEDELQRKWDCLEVLRKNAGQALAEIRGMGE